MKKINKSLGNPTVRYIAGGVISLLTAGAMKLMEKKREDKNYPPENEVQI